MPSPGANEIEDVGGSFCNRDFDTVAIFKVILPDSEGPIAGRQELIPSFQKRIAESHQRGLELDDELRQTLLDKCNATIETGMLLRTAERQLRPHEWDQVKSKLPFDSSALAAYCSFARKAKDKPCDDLQSALRSIQDALRTTGTLPLAPGHSEQRLHEAEPNFFVNVNLTISALVSRFRKYVRKSPVRNWDQQTAELFLRSLKPLMEVHREVALWLKSR